MENKEATKIYELFCEHVDPAGTCPPDKSYFESSYVGSWPTLKDFMKVFYAGYVLGYTQLKGFEAIGQVQDYIDFEKMALRFFEVDGDHFYVKDDEGTVHVFRNV